MKQCGVKKSHKILEGFSIVLEGVGYLVSAAAPVCFWEHLASIASRACPVG